MGQKHRDKPAKGPKATTTTSNGHKQTSPFVQVTTALYLPLSPNAYNFPLSGLIAEHISPNIMTYFRPLEGVLLAFHHPRISEHPTDRPHAAHDHGVNGVLTRSVDEGAVTYVWLTAEFVLFRPVRGSVLEGFVTVGNESLLGLVCYNYFNAAIESTGLPSEWKWNGLCWVDEDGEEVAGLRAFTVTDVEVSGTESMTIKGTMRNAEP